MTASDAPVYLLPTHDAGKQFVLRGLRGAITMLNLLRFRDVADYTANPELAPVAPISGKDAFDRYIAHTLPLLRESGGDILYLGSGGPLLIGPETQRWDLAMLVRQESMMSFLDFATNQAYLAGIGHRTAAIEDSRLLPLTDIVLPA